VIAGVVGSKYPRYRLMGDTVNTASRMSTTCVPGMTQLSRWAKDLLPKGQFEYEEAGPIAVKGKGDMYVYRLLPAKEQVYDWKAVKTGTLHTTHTYTQ
jgi:class 3 adenylate cyclase